MWVRRQWRGSIGFTRRGSAGGRRCRGVQTGYGDSPYQSLSSFAGNPLLISPDWLIEDGLLRASDCAGGSFSAAAVDFDAVKRFKYTLLETAWGNFRTGARSDLRLAFELFTQAHADWLDDYALFRALKARYGGASYLQWPEDLVRRTPAAFEQARRDLASQVEEVRFAQFLLSVQGARLKAHARAKGVRLIGDLPFFVSPDSSDVWANPELFLLDAHYRPRVVAGVPPDYFSSQGQRWGNPIYGMRLPPAATDGASTACVPCSLTSTRSASITSADSPRRGTSRPGRRTRRPVSGCQALAPQRRRRMGDRKAPTPPPAPPDSRSTNTNSLPSAPPPQYKPAPPPPPPPKR